MNQQTSTSEAAAPRVAFPLLAALSLIAIALWLSVSLARISHPFALEWIESGSLQQVGRILDGKPLFAAPSIEYVPFIYAPLYFYASAFASRVFGEGFTALRLVSLLSTIALLVLLFEWARRETRSVLAALLAPGLFAACFRMGGAWFDVARVDMLFLLLAFAALFVLRFVRGSLALVLGGVLLATVFHVKQQTLVIAAIMSLWAVLSLRARGLLLPITFAALIGAATLVFNVQTAGWYGYYVFVLPGGHGNEWHRTGEFIARDLLGNLHVALIAAAALLVRLPASTRVQPERDATRAKQTRPTSDETFYAFALAATLITSWLSRIHWGGYDNVLLPACAMLAVAAAVWVHRVESAAERQALPARLVWLVRGALVAQFAALAYNPLAQIPPATDFVAGRYLVARIEEASGEVLVPRHPYLATLAGKSEWMHWMAYYDFIRAARPELARDLRRELDAALRQHVFAAVVVDGEGDIAGLLDTYLPQATVFADDRAFRPVTGFATRPEFWCVPRGDSGPIGTASQPAQRP